jgi:hypothetical protein
MMMNAEGVIRKLYGLLKKGDLISVLCMFSKKVLKSIQKKIRSLRLLVLFFFTFLYRSKNKYLILAGLSPSYEL